MRVLQAIVTSAFVVALSGCGGGGSGSEPAASPDEPSGVIGDDDGGMATPPDPLSDVARYSVLVQNFWGEEDFPQGYPANAHLSLFGGAVHNAAVSFWSFGESLSPGMIKLAEDGTIDLLLSEVQPALENGTADSVVEERVFTDPPTADGPGELRFELQFKRDYPLVTMVSMLGPSPDWFVGVDGLSLLGDQGTWHAELTVDLPLYDGGSRSNMTPVMHGPSIRPPEPVGYVAYDSAMGVYLAATEPQNVAKLVFTRLE